MARIVQCESGGDPGAVSPPDSDGLRNYGLGQLHGEPEGLEPEYNVRRMHEKWLASGLSPWAGSAGCWR